VFLGFLQVAFGEALGGFVQQSHGVEGFVYLFVGQVRAFCSSSLLKPIVASSFQGGASPLFSIWSSSRYNPYFQESVRECLELHYLVNLCSLAG